MASSFVMYSILRDTTITPDFSLSKITTAFYNTI
jgi:hypothetical protein